ncbi:MAG TPA: DUF4097 family beta strand repeat-containing protein, partial [Candidatus Binatia bacterium]|nr:DUF4097 family beta strand repeat-containing protein [Candidatus Binatia bacterium]
MKNWSLCTTFLAAALLSAAAHATDRSVHSTQDIAAGGRLVVRNVAGSVTVERGSSGTLELNGEVEEGADLQLKGSPAERTIEVVQPKQSKETLNADLHIRVAAGVALDIETVSADVLVRAMEGTVTVRTVSGGVRMDVASTAVELRTVSGDIELHAPSAKTSLQTVSGNVTADGV